MFVRDRNALGISQGVASGPAESAPMILAAPVASERFGYQPARKRFAASLVATLIHVAMLLAFLTWHGTVRVRPPTPSLTVTLLPLSPPARAEPYPPIPRRPS